MLDKKTENGAFLVGQINPYRIREGIKANWEEILGRVERGNEVAKRTRALSQKW